MLIAASLLLGASVLFVSFVDLLSERLAAWTGTGLSGIAFCLMAATYFGVRFSGQGVMASASGNMLML